MLTENFPHLLVNICKSTSFQRALSQSHDCETYAMCLRLRLRVFIGLFAYIKTGNTKVNACNQIIRMSSNDHFLKTVNEIEVVDKFAYTRYHHVITSTTIRNRTNNFVLHILKLIPTHRTIKCFKKNKKEL